MRLGRVALSLIALVAACTDFRAPYAGGRVPQDETVLGGRVELVPPLGEGEQDISGIQTIEMEGRIFLLTDDHPRVLQGDPTYEDYEDGISAPLGEPFWVTVPNKPLYVLGASIVLRTAPVVEMAHLPGGLRVDVQPGDSAVYMGTLRYTRDEFFDVTGVEVVDDYDRAVGDYEERFEHAAPLAKRLLVRGPGPQVDAVAR